MSKPAQHDIPTKSSSTEVSKQPRLDLQDQIQRAITLATQLRQAASKEHLDSKEWAANQTAANEFLRTFDVIATESIKGLATTQIKLEVRLRMDALNSRANGN